MVASFSTGAASASTSSLNRLSMPPALMPVPVGRLSRRVSIRFLWRRPSSRPWRNCVTTPPTGRTTIRSTQFATVMIAISVQTLSPTAASPVIASKIARMRSPKGITNPQSSSAKRPASAITGPQRQASLSRYGVVLKTAPPRARS